MPGPKCQLKKCELYQLGDAYHPSSELRHIHPKFEGLSMVHRSRLHPLSNPEAKNLCLKTPETMDRCVWVCKLLQSLSGYLPAFLNHGNRCR